MRQAILGASTRSSLQSAAATTAPTISISDATITEGDSGTREASFTVTLSEASRQTVKVNYATADVTAPAGVDYTSRTGTLSFRAGTTSATVTVPILGDSVPENTETFTVNLSNPVRANISDGSGTGTIFDNDPPNDPPTIGSLSATPEPVTVGSSVTLTASDVNDTDGSVISVSFYRESNAIEGLQTGSDGDTLVDTVSSDTGDWSTTVTTTDLAAGTYTYYAQATDDADAVSDVVSTTSTVQGAASSQIAFAINFIDGPDEGFYDATLGAARQAALQFALDIWSSILVVAYEGETITIIASMDPLGGTPTSAVLAGAGPESFYSDGGAAFGTPTAYGAPLANHLYGSDLDPASAEISIIFNSDVDNATVLGSQDWYYGIDANPGSHFDFVTVALHEIGHGLNFFDLIEPNFGFYYFGMPGIYDRFLENATGTRLTSMSFFQRRNALTSGALYWGGADGTAGNGGIRPRLFAPNPYQSGSSVSHLDETTHGFELMSPYYSGPNHAPSNLEIGMLSDMGWTVAGSAVAPSSIASYQSQESGAASGFSRLDTPQALQDGWEVTLSSSDPYSRSEPSRQARGFDDSSLNELASSLIYARSQDDAPESMISLGGKSRKAARLRSAIA